MEKAYETYKDSGVEWIGEIPKSWDVIKMKWLSPVNRGASPRPIADPKYFDDNGEFAWVRIADVSASERYLRYTTEKLSELGSSLSVKRYPGDFFLSIAGSVGKPIITKIKCCIHDGFVWFPELKVNPEYLYYLFQSDLPFTGLGKMGTQLNLNTETIGNIMIPISSNKEVEGIISYLDYQTNKIDALISKKETLIQKLQKQRQAIINEAVTKGLNKNVELKDSGIEWLGNIPEHWGVVKFIRFCNLQQGLQIPISQRVLEKVNGALEYITTKSIHNPDDYRQYVVGAKQSVICNEDEVLLGRTGNTGEVVTGVSGVFHNNFFKINFNEDFITKDYLVHYLNTSFIQELIGIAAGTTTIPDLNHGDFLNLPFIMPPIKEQIDIVEKINSKYQIIDKSIPDMQASIQKLKEYRQSLISEAVTGKIDVRDWQQPNS